MLKEFIAVSLIFANILGAWNWISERRLNRKANELLQRVQTLMVLSHIEFDDLPDENEFAELKIRSLEQKIRYLEAYLLNYMYQEKGKSCNHKEQ